ncbi:MAG: globin [Dermatophilaceae bacterium]
MTFYDEVGGHETFARLVRGFYAGVAADPPLRDLYPEADLEPAQRRLRMFLEQYFGGPTAYSQERGHPRLRMRHAPYAVTPQQRDRWLRHMFASVEDLVADGTLDEEHEAELRDYLTRAADMLVNAGFVTPPDGSSLT